MPRIEKPTDRVLLQAQPGCESDVRDALFSHRRIEGQLRRDDGRHGDQHLSLR